MSVKLTAEESCRQVLKSIADECDAEALARADGYLYRYVREETVLRDCGQRGVCRTPPGCARSSRSWSGARAPEGAPRGT